MDAERSNRRGSRDYDSSYFLDRASIGVGIANAFLMAQILLQDNAGGDMSLMAGFFVGLGAAAIDMMRASAIDSIGSTNELN